MHNAAIYHCLRCGRVDHRELELDVPGCCGRKMIKSAEETIFDPEPGSPRQDLSSRHAEAGWENSAASRTAAMV